jgi:hypothetical protein
MALNLIDLPTQGGGWFKPEPEMLEYKAFLIEVRDFERQRPTPYGPKDSALVDLTVFADADSLNNGEPTEIKEGTRIEQTVLSRDLAPVKGGATIVTLAQIPSKKPGQKPAWVWRQASADVKKKVASYAEAREAAVDAAIADAPSFD